MTLLRRLAVHTLKTVIWLSSSDNRKWAEAMFAEMDCIPSDWKAFVWALGSLRVLFVAQRTGLASLEEVPNAARIMADEGFIRFWFCLVANLMLLVFFAHFSLHAPTTMQRAGSALMVVAMIYLMKEVVAARPHPLPSQDNLTAQIASYRSELIRKRDFHRGNSVWLRIAVLMPGFLLLCLGNISAQPATVRTQIGCLATYFFLSLLAIPNNLRFAKRYARLLRNLDMLESKDK